MDRAGIHRAVAAFAISTLLLPAPSARAEQSSAPRAAVGAGTIAAPPTTGIVIGSAWKGDSTPFPYARLRLRDVETGRAVARAESDAQGRFRFDRTNPGAYVVELLSGDDKVLAVGDLFAVTAGEQATTVVRLTSKSPWVAGFFGNAAAAVISAASTIGVTAVGSSGRPASPQ